MILLYCIVNARESNLKNHNLERIITHEDFQDTGLDANNIDNE